MTLSSPLFGRLLLSLAIFTLPRPLPADAPEGGWTQAESKLKAAVAAGSISAAKRIVGELARSGEPKGLRLIIDHAIGCKYPEIYKQAAGWLREASEPRLRGVVYEALEKSNDYRTRIILIAVISHWKDDPRAMEALTGRLGDIRKEVVFAALERIRDFQQPQRALPALIEELETRERRKRDRVYFDLRRTLKSLTGHDFEVAADWKNYWKAIQSGIKIPEPKKGGVTQLYRPPSFFTVSVESDRVAFLIDVSGSMAIEDPVLAPDAPEKKRAEREGITVVVRSPSGKGGAEPAPKPQKMRSRLSAVQQELVRTIEALPESVYFTVLGFNHEIALLDGTATLMPATTPNKSRAIQWVKRFHPSGATRTDLALLQALNMSQVDTICLLTDGAPKNEQNERIAPEYVYQLVRQENRFHRCRINTIGFLQAGKSMRAFVKELARQNEGQCILLE